MRVRFMFHCPECSSLLFRPSQSRARKDSFLSVFGVHPHRCQICRTRFYLFKPSFLRSFMPGRRVQPEPNGLQPAVKVDNRPFAWEMAQNASESRRNT